jgi:hypothetical protein
MTETLPTHAEPSVQSHRWLFASLVFVLITAIPNISYPIGRDQATYGVIGQGLLNGQQLYRDLWDNKPPGIFALYALLVKAFGHVMWSVGLVDILWLLVISYCIFRFAERYLGTGAAVIAVVVDAAWHTRIGYVDAAQPECFLMVAVFLGFFIASAQSPWPMTRQFVAGLLMGAAFWLKYNALAFFPLIALVPCVDWARLDLSPRQIGFLVPKRLLLKRTVALLAGFLTAVGVVLAYFWWAGSWAALKEVQFHVLPRYAAMAVERIPHYWLLPVGATLVHLGIWTVLATGASILVAEKRGFSGFLPVLAAATMGYAVTASQIRFPPYAFETSFPFFGMVWGHLGTSLLSRMRAALRPNSQHSQLIARSAAVGLAALILWYPVRGEVRFVFQRYTDLAAWSHDPQRFYANYPGVRFKIEHLPGKLKVIEELQKSLKPGDQIFIWGTDPLIYYLTDRQPPTRFVSNLALISPWGPPAWRQELIQNLSERHPSFIVVSQHDQVSEIAFTNLDSEQFLSIYTGLGDLISASYQRVGEFPDFVLYQLKTQPKAP